MSEAKKVKKILIVDDDPIQIKIIENWLKDEPCELIVTTEAPDGLQMAMTKSPDLIILDVMMPIINGYNFCSLLKKQEEHKHIPIILITSRDEKKDIDIGMEMGADAYLTKPVQREDFLKTLKLF
jgi:two-component system cell cycle response regulator